MHIPLFLRTDFVGLHEKWMASLVKLADHHQTELRASYDALQRDCRQARFRLLAVGQLTLAIVATICTFIARASTRLHQNAARNDDTIASGDLTESSEPGSSDEAGWRFNLLGAMQRSLVETVNHIKPHTEAVSTASREIASRSATLSARTEPKARVPEEAASFMEELTSTFKHDAEKRQSTVTANQDWHEFLRLRSTGLGMGGCYLIGASADISVRWFSAQNNSARLTVLWEGLIGSADAENDAEWGSRAVLHTCCR